ncbi:MAG TPA: VOC family protein, partial [Rhodopila sp.]|nr:VOC family protein [Rhodopila sp.]
MTEPKLTYVALISRDVAAASHLLGDVLGLARSFCPAEDGDVPVFAAGQAALALFPPGDRFVDGETRTGVHHIGLDAGGQVQAVPAPRPALGGGVRRALPIAETSGVRVFLTDAPDIPRNGGGSLIERIDHLGIASADNQAAVAVFNRRMGLPVESQQTDVEVETAVESF